MQIALNAPSEVHGHLLKGGWSIVDAGAATRTPMRTGTTCAAPVPSSRSPSTRTSPPSVAGFSDRSAAYLATGRPVILEDTGFSDFLPCGEGLLSYRSRREALAAIRAVKEGYAAHCRAARSVAENHFDADSVLSELLERSL